MVFQFHPSHREGSIPQQRRVGRQAQGCLLVRGHAIEGQSFCHFQRSSGQIEKVCARQGGSPVGLQESRDLQAGGGQGKGGIVGVQHSGNRSSLAEGQGAARRLQRPLNAGRSNQRQIGLARVQGRAVVEGERVLNAQIGAGGSQTQEVAGQFQRSDAEGVVAGKRGVVEQAHRGGVRIQGAVVHVERLGQFQNTALQIEHAGIS